MSINLTGFSQHSEFADQLHNERGGGMEGLLLHDPPGLFAAAQLDPDFPVLLPEHDCRTQNSDCSDVSTL